MSGTAKSHVPSHYFPTVSFPILTTPVARCNLTRISFAGAFPNYHIFVIPTSSASLSSLPALNTALDTLPMQTDLKGYFDWNVDSGIPIGSDITIAIRDGSGAWAFSESRKVVQNLGGADVTCGINAYKWDQGSSPLTHNCSATTDLYFSTCHIAVRPGWHLFGLPNTAASVLVLLLLIAVSILVLLFLIGLFVGAQEAKDKGESQQEEAQLLLTTLDIEEEKEFEMTRGKREEVHVKEISDRTGSGELLD